MVRFDPSALVAALRVGLVLRSDEPNSNGQPMSYDQSSDVPNAATSSFVGGPREYGDGPLYLPSATSQLIQAAASTPFTVQSVGDPACTPVPYTVAPVPLPALPSPDPALATVYRYRQQQGVNLGSWFMLEAWMVPSLFNCASAPGISEYDVATGWNGDSKSVLERHWDSFITESDFKWLSGLGINTVRLPLGYWHIGTGETDWVKGTMYEGVRDSYSGAWPRVLRVVNWAAKHGIGVLIDLHGAPGSQNGQQHSGVSDGQTNLFSSPDNIMKTIQVLQFLTRTFVNVPNIVGIQLLNEPANVPEVWDFYNTALDALRTVTPEAQSFPFYLHDAFDLEKGSSYVMSRGREWNVLDHHAYYVFTPWDDAEPVASHIVDISQAGNVGSDLMRNGMKLNGNFLIGEWSCALTDNSMSGESDPVSARRQFCEIQEQTYRDVSSGSTFWSLTKENCDQDPGWCFKSAVGNALPGSFFSFEGLTVPWSLSQAINPNVASVATNSTVEEGNRGPTSDPVHPISWAAVAPTTLISTSSLITDVPTPTSSVDAVDALTSFGAEGEITSSFTSDVSSTEPTANPSAFIPRRRETDSSAEDERLASNSTPFPIQFFGRRHHIGFREHRALAIHKRRTASDQQSPFHFASADSVSPPEVSTTSLMVTPTSASQAEVPAPDQTRRDGNTPQATTAALLTPAQQAIQRGFSDGFVTAKLFAQQGPGMSRLGFKWQYVEDSLAAHGPSVIQPGKEGYYREWFDKGLLQGEAMVAKVIAKMNAQSSA